MRNFTKLAAVAALGALLQAPAQATVINFDTLSANEAINTQFAGQGVLVSGSLTALNNTFGGAVNVPTLPNYANVGGTGMTISFVDPTNSLINATTDFVSFVNAGLFAGGGFYGGLSVSVRDLLGVELATATINPIGPGVGRAAIITSFSVAGIHSLAFSYISNPNGGAIAPIDDLTFNTVSPVAPPTPSSNVPEPMTLSLLGAGLAGLGLARRKRG